MRSGGLIFYIKEGKLWQHSLIRKLAVLLTRHPTMLRTAIAIVLLGCVSATYYKVGSFGIRPMSSKGFLGKQGYRNLFGVSGGGYPKDFGIGAGYPKDLGIGAGYPKDIRIGAGYPKDFGIGAGYPKDFGIGGGYPKDLGMGAGYPKNFGIGAGYPKDFGISKGYPKDLGIGAGYPKDLGISKGYPKDLGISGGYPKSFENSNGYPKDFGMVGGYPKGGFSDFSKAGYPKGKFMDGGLLQGNNGFFGGNNGMYMNEMMNSGLYPSGFEGWNSFATDFGMGFQGVGGYPKFNKGGFGSMAGAYNIKGFKKGTY